MKGIWERQGGILLILLGSLAATAAGELTNITYDSDYDLFYQESFHTLFPRVKEAVPRAYEHIHTLWGLEESGGLRYPLKVQVKKIKSHTLQRWEAAYVQSEENGSDVRQVLVVDIGTYIQEPHEDVEMVVTHEMAHVILRDVLNGPHVKSIPPWFNEGLAQSVTQEGTLRVQADRDALRHSSAHLLLCDLDGPIDEFAHGPFNGGCYPEFYLAVKRLEQLGGPEALRKAITGLREGTAMSDLVKSITGKDWFSFKQDVEHYTNAIFAGSVPVP